MRCDAIRYDMMCEDDKNGNDNDKQQQIEHVRTYLYKNIPIHLEHTLRHVLLYVMHDDGKRENVFGNATVAT